MAAVSANPEHSGAASWGEKLREQSCRLTRPRRAILAVLEQEARPLTPRAIFQSMPRGSCDLATVYRSLRLLEEMSLVKKFQFGAGAAHFALLAEGESTHRHHLVCTKCTRIVEIGECIVRELEQRVALQSRFRAVTHRLEFFGVCPACQ